MKLVGGPCDGQTVTISEEAGGPDLRLEGMVLERHFDGYGKMQIILRFDPNPPPSLPGITERYWCKDGAWHYLPPEDTTGFRATPPMMTE
jgi:hypothetical protein